MNEAQANGSATGNLDSGCLASFVEHELEALHEANLYRSMRRFSGPPGPRRNIGDREVLNLAGSNSLGLAGDPRVVEAAEAAVREWGGAAGGSRLIGGNIELHEALERDLAEFSGTQGALLFGSGYLANLGVITALAGPRDVIVSDALNHASIIDACRLSRAQTRVFAHNDVEDFARKVDRLEGFRRRFLVVDGVYSMDGDVAPLREIVPIAREHGMTIVVDDAHGVGVLGQRGRGATELEDVTADVTIGNLAKAIGSFGAYVACSAAVRELLINLARPFIFTCALPPASVGAAIGGLRVLTAEPWRRDSLLARSRQLREGLRAAGFDTGASQTHIIPAIVGDNRSAMRLCEAALEHGVHVQGIRYPSVPKGTARLRFTPMCSHTGEDIATAVAVVSEQWRRIRS